MQPNYALVLLSFNHPDLTERCLQSALDLQFPADQIFLIHNGSEEKFCTRLYVSFPKVNHILISENAGFTGGANRGLTEAFKNYSHVFFITNDTEMISLPEVYPIQLDLLSPLILKRKTESVDSVIGLIDLKFGNLRHVRQAEEIATLTEQQMTYVPGTAFGINKKTFESLGGFDETFHTYWEDVDLSLRAHDEKMRIAHSDLFRLRHKIGKTCHKNRFYTLYLFQRNRRKLMQKRKLAGPHFYTVYGMHMLKLLLKILIKPERTTPLRYWWKAIYD
ncbi:MAG: glycosyltransferase [Bdellovibrionaceae bacterium]|nr:glycosyltransferase [Bdellovibrio sp.]